MEQLFAVILLIGRADPSIAGPPIVWTELASGAADLGSTVLCQQLLMDALQQVPEVQPLGELTPRLESSLSKLATPWAPTYGNTFIYGVF